jgi:hypothetical protein
MAGRPQAGFLKKHIWIDEITVADRQAGSTDRMRAAAAASATNHLALIAQRTIQPYRRSQTGTRFNECHYYPLPLPAQVLEQYGAQEFTLKATLSCFIDPNPGRSAAIDPQRYQSFGLRSI